MNRATPLKRTPFKRKNIQSKVAQSDSQRGENAIKLRVRMTTKSKPATPEFRGSFPKSQPVRSEAYRRLVAALPCVICGIAGQSQAAHGSGAGTAVCKGMGIKSCDLNCFAACVRCHHELDQHALFSKAVRHQLEPAWAADTQRKIHAMGKWPKGIPYPHQQEQA